MTILEEYKGRLNNSDCEIITETHDVTVIDNTDVVVAGGGIAGITAALSAARNGAKVILIEKEGYLGGYATGGLVNFAGRYQDWYERVVGGLAEEILEQLKQDGAAIETEYDVCKEHPWLAKEQNWKDKYFSNTEGLKRTGVQFDTEKMKLLADNLLSKAKVKVLLHTFVTGAHQENGRLKYVILGSKSGHFAIGAKFFIDCTGDGDLAALAGANFEKGRPEDGKMLPVSLMFRLRGVNVKEAIEYQISDYGYANLIKELKQKGELNIPHSYILVRPTVYQDGLEINGTRITNIDGTNIFDLTKAEIELRSQTRMLEEMFKRYVPGCSKAYVSETASLIGVRETRRIIGEYVVQDKDLLDTFKFDDVVGRATSHIDIHNPEGSGYDIRPIKAGDWYEIPYRSLVVKGLDNLFVAGRCISASPVAQAALRLYLSVFVSGQAAGTGAALCIKENVKARELNIRLLQKTLILQGVKLRDDIIEQTGLSK